MAAPVVVTSKLPLGKNCELCRTDGSPCRVRCSRGCGLPCSSWCNPEGRLITFDDDRFCKTCQGQPAEAGEPPCRKWGRRPGSTPHNKPWAPNGGVHEYLKEVEALRGKLKELRGTTPRKLPQPPTSPGLKSSNSVVSSSPPSPHRVGPTDPEPKRIRFPSDSECPVVCVEAAPKRPREKSPLILNPKNSPNDYEIQFSPLPPSTGSKTSETASFERENGDKYFLKVNRNNEVSCSLSVNRNATSKVSSDCSDKTKVPGESRPAENKLKNLISCDSPSVNFTELSPETDGFPFPLPSALPNELPSVEVDYGSGVRFSLFSNVPPYIKFRSHDAPETKLPKAIKKVLKWKLSTITPLVVKHTVTASGFRIVRRAGDWGGIWGRHMKSLCFKTLGDYQKINHMPGTFQIGRKDRLWKNINRLTLKFGKKEFGFIPRTYILPQDTKALRQVWDRNGSKNKWIVKPPAAARGTGIKVINKWTQIPKKCPVIVQKYISNPYLINGNKFDLRLYVLVTSFNPLRVYMFTNGLVRFASVKYSDEAATLANRYMHLTNYSINKLSTNYAQNEDAEACVGHKWTIRSLWSYLEGSVNVDALWRSLVDLVIKTMISGEGAISNLTSANLNSRYSAYELFGVDVLLDENLKPWLLEVNISPSLHSTSPLDIAVKGPLVKDLLNIVGYHIPDKFNDTQKVDLAKMIGLTGPLCYDSRIYIPEISPAEKNKQIHFSLSDERCTYLDSILEDLTPDDVRHLIVYEDELSQAGDFQRIFPTENTHEYHQYFDEHKYYNKLFDAWETKYCNNREEGIKLLDSKCRLEIHLDVTHVEPRQLTFCQSDISIVGDSLEANEKAGDPETNKIRKPRCKPRLNSRLSRSFQLKYRSRRPTYLTALRK